MGLEHLSQAEIKWEVQNDIGLNRIKQTCYDHFKMYNLKTALDLIEQGTWVASADLTDAYYSVTVNNSQKKFLRFRMGWKLIE